MNLENELENLRYFSENTTKNKHQELYQYILDNTKFLSKDASFKERKYCITNNIKAIPYCQICGKLLKFNVSKYDKTCCYECAQKLKGASGKTTKLKNNPNYYADWSNKYQQNCLSKYGVNTYMKTLKFREKSLLCEHNHAQGAITLKNKSAEDKKIIKDKKYNTCFKKFGMGSNGKAIAKAYSLFTKEDWKNKKAKIDITIKQKYNLNNFGDLGRYLKNKKYIKHFDIYNDNELFIEKSLELNKDIIKISEYFEVSTPCIYRKLISLNVIKLEDRRKYNKGENSVHAFLNINNIKVEKNKRKYLDNKYEIDLYLPDYNIGIEYNGMYWHSSTNNTPVKYHQEKSLLAESKGIRLIHIYEDEWLNPIKRKLIEDIILHACNIQNTHKIYARKCIIKEISNKDYINFCDNNHIQGYKEASVKLGLYYNDQLIQIASFSKSRFDKKYQWEWIRGCTLINYNIIGGTSKLFSYFIKHYNPNSVVCYVDYNKFNGNSYKQIGFNFVKLTDPDLFYIDTKTCERYNRNPSKRNEYDLKVINREFYLIRGAGNLKLEYIKKFEEAIITQ